MFLNTKIHYIHFHKYTPISHFITWNKIVFFFSNFLPRLYFNIICKNIMKIFQKFEVGYTQTCTSLESSTMWHFRRVIVMCFHPTINYGWFHVPLFNSKKKGSEKVKKMNQCLPTHHPLDVKLCGPITSSAPSTWCQIMWSNNLLCTIHLMSNFLVQ